MATLRLFTLAFLRPILRWLKLDDPWRRVDARVSLSAYGPGSQHDFPWYFEGESQVPVSSLEDVQLWLASCEYVRDRDLFREPDHWQHPLTFEQIRRGDCEDHALWAWRKLVDLGYDADLIVGTTLPRTEPPTTHAWIVYRREGKAFLLESVSKDPGAMVRPLEEAKAHYLPLVGVDSRRERFAFTAFLVDIPTG